MIVSTGYGAEIDALVSAISASAALTFKGSAPAVAIGASIARNLIGFDEFGGPNPLEVSVSSHAKRFW